MAGLLLGIFQRWSASLWASCPTVWPPSWWKYFTLCLIRIPQVSTYGCCLFSCHLLSSACFSFFCSFSLDSCRCSQISLSAIYYSWTKPVFLTSHPRGSLPIAAGHCWPPSSVSTSVMYQKAQTEHSSLGWSCGYWTEGKITPSMISLQSFYYNRVSETLSPWTKPDPCTSQ